MYEDLYCARGNCENDMKAVKGDLHSDRTSATTFLANAVRLLLACGASVLHRGCQVKCVTFSHLYPLPKQHHELIQGRFPLRNRLSPLFSDMLQTHVQHFEDRLVIRERTTPFQYFPQRIV